MTSTRGCHAVASRTIFERHRPAPDSEKLPPMPQTVLIADPDPELARALAEQLEDAGFAAVIAVSAAVAADGIKSGVADALVIASSLPDTDVPAFCQDLRQNGAALPLILLCRASDPVGLSEAAGADDSFVRPIRLGALIGRLRQLLEPGMADGEDPVTVGPYRFEAAGKRLVAGDGAPIIRLTEKETEILRHLAGAGAATVPREQLLREIWRYHPDVTTHTLETHVYRLRQKIETAESGPILVTEPGGYRLAGAGLAQASVIVTGT